MMNQQPFLVTDFAIEFALDVPDMQPDELVNPQASPTGLVLAPLSTRQS